MTFPWKFFIWFLYYLKITSRTGIYKKTVTTKYDLSKFKKATFHQNRTYGRYPEKFNYRKKQKLLRYITKRPNSINIDRFVGPHRGPDIITKSTFWAPGLQNRHFPRTIDKVRQLLEKAPVMQIGDNQLNIYSQLADSVRQTSVTLGRDIATDAQLGWEYPWITSYDDLKPNINTSKSGVSRLLLFYFILFFIKFIVKFAFKV